MPKSAGSRYLLLVLSLIVALGMTGCSKKSNTGTTAGKKQLKICVDIKDKHTVDVIKFLIDEYKKENKDIEIDLNNPLNNGKICDDVSKGSTGDLIITSRNTMLELQKKGLLSDLSNFYSKNKISDKFYNIVCSYGRISDKYYGIAVMPYTLEILYSSQALEKLNIPPPKNITDLVQVMKRINESKIKVPVVLTDDLDMYNALAAILFSNIVDMQKLEKSYGSGTNSYKDIKEVQQVFDNINLLVRQGTITPETVETGTDNSVSRLAKGDIPFMMTISYYTKEIKEEKVGAVETYNISQIKENVPVIVNGLICVPANSKNEEEVNNLMEFLFSEKTQKKLVSEGFVTGNKEANGTMVGINKIINDHLSTANDNSIVYIYDFPKKYQPIFESKILKVLSGKHNGNEWNEILDEANK